MREEIRKFNKYEAYKFTLEWKKRLDQENLDGRLRTDLLNFFKTVYQSKILDTANQDYFKGLFNEDMAGIMSDLTKENFLEIINRILQDSNISSAPIEWRRRPKMKLSPPPKDMFMSAEEVGPRGLELLEKGRFNPVVKYDALASTKDREVKEAKMIKTHFRLRDRERDQLNTWLNQCSVSGGLRSRLQNIIDCPLVISCCGVDRMFYANSIYNKDFTAESLKNIIARTNIHGLLDLEEIKLAFEEIYKNNNIKNSLKGKFDSSGKDDYWSCMFRGEACYDFNYGGQPISFLEGLTRRAFLIPVLGILSYLKKCSSVEIDAEQVIASVIRLSFSDFQGICYSLFRNIVNDVSLDEEQSLNLMKYYKREFFLQYSLFVKSTDEKKVVNDFFNKLFLAREKSLQWAKEKLGEVSSKEKKAEDQIFLPFSLKGETSIPSLTFQGFDELETATYARELHWDANNIQNLEFDKVFPGSLGVWKYGVNIRNNMKAMLRMTEDEMLAYKPVLEKHLFSTQSMTDAKDRMLEIFKLMQQDAKLDLLPQCVLLTGAGCQFASSQKEFTTRLGIIGVETDDDFTVELGNAFFKSETLNHTSFSPVYSLNYLKSKLKQGHHLSYNGQGYQFLSNLGELSAVFRSRDRRCSDALRGKNIQYQESVRRINNKTKLYLTKRLQLIRDDHLPIGDLLLKEKEVREDGKSTNYSLFRLKEAQSGYSQEEVMQVKVEEDDVRGQSRLALFNTIIEKSATALTTSSGRHGFKETKSIVEAMLLTVAEYSQGHPNDMPAGVKYWYKDKAFQDLLNLNLKLMQLGVRLSKDDIKHVSLAVQMCGVGLTDTVSGKYYDDKKGKKGARMHRFAIAMLNQYGSVENMQSAFGLKLGVKTATETRPIK